MREDEDIDGLAAEYVLDSLDPRERREVEERCKRDRQLCDPEQDCRRLTINSFGLSGFLLMLPRATGKRKMDGSETGVTRSARLARAGLAPPARSCRYGLAIASEIRPGHADAACGKQAAWTFVPLAPLRMRNAPPHL